MTTQTPLAVLLSPRPQAVRAARRAGARTLVLVPGLSAPGARRAAAAADEVRTVDWTDHPQLMAAIGHLAGLPARTCVFGFGETSALIAARANEALRFPGNPHAAVAYLTDKAALRGKVNPFTGSPVRFEHCDRAAHLMAAAERVGYPCVAKPRTGAGGRDIHLLRDAADASVLAAGLPPEPALIVEEFLQGPEYSVEAHSHAGSHTVLAMARKYTSGTPGGAELGYDVPAELDAVTTGRVQELVTATLDTAGHRTGPSQTEIVLTDRGPRLIESHAHPGAEYISDLLLMATGTDLVALTVASALGLPEPAGAARDRHAGIRFLRLPPGVLQAVEGVGEVRALPGVAEVKISVPVGSHVPEATSRVAGHGYITASAADPQELEAVLRKAQDALRPQVTVPPAQQTSPASQPSPPYQQSPQPQKKQTKKEEEQTAA